MEHAYKSRTKYIKGGKICSLDELLQQDQVYFYDKVTHRSWFENWQIGWAKAHIDFGHLHFAIRKKDEDE